MITKFTFSKYTTLVIMINNPDWQKPKGKPYHLQPSPDCIKKLVDCVEMFNKDEIDFSEE